MIEGNFVAGRVFDWTVPGEVVLMNNPGAVGDFVASAQVEGQHPMAFTDGNGLRRPVQYDWLDYQQSRTRYRAFAQNDILTGKMSGCWLLRYSVNGQWRAGHVGTGINAAADNQATRAAAADAMPDNATGFLPHARWTRGELTALERQYRGEGSFILGLITTAGGFFSIAMVSRLAADDEDDEDDEDAASHASGPSGVGRPPARPPAAKSGFSLFKFRVRPFRFRSKTKKKRFKFEMADIGPLENVVAGDGRPRELVCGGCRRCDPVDGEDLLERMRNR